MGMRTKIRTKTGKRRHRSDGSVKARPRRRSLRTRDSLADEWADNMRDAPYGWLGGCGKY